MRSSSPHQMKKMDYGDDYASTFVQREDTEELDTVDDTQQATQQLEQAEFESMRKARNNSGLSEHDASDVFCVLHPASPAAFRIVKDTALAKAQHILQNERWRNSQRNRYRPLFQQDEAVVNPFEEAQDLALRFSSKVVDMDVGFCFGRNSQVCDINLDKEDKQKRVSNTHFRIFINDHGILMMEDLSSNGTIVDGIPIGGRQRRANGPTYPRTHMLSSGSVIEILSDSTEDTIKFILRIPPRDEAETEYELNFRDYMYRRALAHVHKKQGLLLPAGGIESLLKNNASAAARNRSTIGINPPGTKANYGMQWNGGEKYTCTGTVGHGAFATVYQIATRWNGELFAAKELEKKRFIKQGMLDDRLSNELKIMKSIRHRYIIDYIDYVETSSHLYIIMEYVRYGDLQGYMQPKSGAIRTVPEEPARVMSAQVLEALSYLHDKNITHRDIKPDNILICSEEPFVVKLTDFGLSKMVKDTTTFLKTFCGTLLYCAPEVFPFNDNEYNSRRPKRTRTDSGRRTYSHLVDIWSYGAVLWYALCGIPPFEGITDGNGRAMFTRIINTPLDTRELVAKGISNECIDLLFRMLEVDPMARFSELDCLDHPWLAPVTILDEHASSRLTSIPELEEGIDCSQLTIHDAAGASTADQGGDQEYRRPKRWKGESFLEIRDVAEPISSPEDSGLFAQMLQNPMTGGEKPKNESAHDKPMAMAPLQREMSILRSSGVFGQDQEWEGIPDTDMDVDSLSRPLTSDTIELSGDLATLKNDAEDIQNSNVVQVDESECKEAEAIKTADENADGPERQHPVLLESMVRDLTMQSPNTSGIVAAIPGEPTTPKTPRAATAATPNLLHTPTAASKGDVQIEPPEEVTPRPRQVQRFSRQINIPIPPSFYYDPLDPSTHNIEYANRMMSLSRSGALAETTSANNVASQSLPSTAITSAAPSSTTQESSQPKSNSQHTEASTSNKENEIQLSLSASHDTHNSGEFEADLSQPLSIPSFPSAPMAILNDPFTKPPPHLGRLASTPNSWGPIILNLTQRATTWGRHPGCTLVYRDSQDTRVPKIGLELWFHAPGIEALDKAGKDWTRLDGLRVIVSTQSSRGIWINGVHLLPTTIEELPQPQAQAQEQENPPASIDTSPRTRKLYGELFTGDEVSMGAPVAGGSAGRDVKMLRFVCEFFVGRAAQRRKAGEPPFVVEEERR